MIAKIKGVFRVALKGVPYRVGYLGKQQLQYISKMLHSTSNYSSTFQKIKSGINIHNFESVLTDIETLNEGEKEMSLRMVLLGIEKKTLPLETVRHIKYKELI